MDFLLALRVFRAGESGKDRLGLASRPGERGGRYGGGGLLVFVAGDLGSIAGLPLSKEPPDFLLFRT